MAQRGIVAAATASKGSDGAAKIVPVTFPVIVATATLDDLTASPG